MNVNDLCNIFTELAHCIKREVYVFRLAIWGLFILWFLFCVWLLQNFRRPRSGSNFKMASASLCLNISVNYVSRTLFYIYFFHAAFLMSHLFYRAWYPLKLVTLSLTLHKSFKILDLTYFGHRACILNDCPIAQLSNGKSQNTRKNFTQTNRTMQKGQLMSA